MKTLYIISKGIGKLSESEMLQLERDNKIPRGSLLENALSATLLDERYLFEKSPRIRRWFYRLIPVQIAQILEALFIQHRYDIILSQSEKVGLPLSLLMKYLGIKKPHVLIISRITSVDEKKARQKEWFLKQTKDRISRFLIWSSVQRKYAIEELKVPSTKVILIKRGTDQLFWSPDSAVSGPGKNDMICSVGMEARDYPTLIEALRTTTIPCHIAVGAARGEIFQTVKKLYDIKQMPQNVTVGYKSPAELRELYMRSLFVVVPLMSTDSDNGLTTILESMAMGKPVICSDVEGQIDVIQDGVTGFYVPQGNPVALRASMIRLWNNPELARQMGQNARRHIEKHHSIEQFVEAIQREVTETASSDRTERRNYHFEGAEA